MNNTIVVNSSNNSNSQIYPRDVDVATLLRFLRHMRIPDLFKKLPDHRQQTKIKYSIGSLVLWAFSACLFRQGSKNAFHTTLDQLELENRAGILRFLEIEENGLPHYSTVDNALTGIDYEEINRSFLRLFKEMNERKFFYQYADRLLPGNTYHIGTDGFHLHTYDHPHMTDDHGNNTCPYCLPRVSHAGTEQEVTRWVHVVITFVFICEEFTIPLYIYPLKANQVDSSQREERFKQECELTAARSVLPIIRKFFPRLNLTFLGDSLYANRPFLSFCDDLNFEYLIVRKENSLKSIGKKCDEFSKLDLYKTAYSHRQKEAKEGKIIQREASWFNGILMSDDSQTNVLRFEETVSSTDGNIKSRYKGEWLCSQRLSKERCFRFAKRGRMRWGQEDFHNTCKNRGFDIKHDMARSNSNLLFVWKMLMFLAFFVFELLSLSTVGKIARGKRSLMKFAKDMLEQLVNILWSQIETSTVLQKAKVQFRFGWGPP
jgi:hypothetical protein